MKVSPFLERNNGDRLVVLEIEELFHLGHTHQNVVDIRSTEGLLKEFCQERILLIGGDGIQTLRNNNHLF